jgi:hypothetical protein
MSRWKSLLTLSLLLFGACRCEPRRLSVDLEGGQIRSLRPAPGATPASFGPPVSLCRVAPDIYLIANYSTLFVFDRRQATLVPLTLEEPAGGSAGGAAPGNWNPTGLACVERSGRVYIANYESNDVLQALCAVPRTSHWRPGRICS